MFLLWYVLAALVIGYYAVEYIKYRDAPPSPWGKLPLLGHLHLVNPKQIHLSFYKWTKNMGDIFFIKMGKVPTVVLNSPEVVKEAFIVKGGKTSDRYQQPSMAVWSNDFTNMALSNGKYWRRARKLWSSAVRNFKVGLSDIIVDEMRNVIADARSKTGNGEIINLYDSVRLYIFNNIYRSTSLKPRVLTTKDNLFVRYIDGMVNFVNTANPRDYLSIGWMYPMTSGEKWLKDTCAKRDKLMQEMLADIEKDMDYEDPKNVVEFLLANKKDINVAQVISDAYMAGVDTTSLTLTWSLVMAANNPEGQRRMHEEIDALTGGRPMTMDQAFHLPYTNAFLKEAIRYKMVLPLSHPHFCQEEVTCAGYTIPAKSQIIINVYALSRDPKLWKRPEEFRPERFLQEEKHVQLLATHGFTNIDNIKLAPFGIGRRACVGYDMGILETVYGFAAFMQAFDIIPANGREMNIREFCTAVVRPSEAPMVKLRYRM